MAEPDDVERLVAEIEATHGPRGSVGLLRLARIVRELLAEHVAAPCLNENIPAELSCDSVWPRTPQVWCAACDNRALRERLCRIARGEA